MTTITQVKTDVIINNLDTILTQLNELITGEDEPVKLTAEYNTILESIEAVENTLESLRTIKSN